MTCVLQTAGISNVESVQYGGSEIKMEILSLANDMRKSCCHVGQRGQRCG